MMMKNYTIKPPPEDKSIEIPFRVVYAIDVYAPDEAKAAEKTWHMMRDKDSFAPILMVIDSHGKQTQLDLSHILEFNKITVGFISQRFRKDGNDKFKCIFQDFIAGDNVQFENVLGDNIKEPQHEYQPFNMTLLSSSQVINWLEEVLSNIDVGGEQSRQFASEIDILTQLLNDLNG